MDKIEYNKDELISRFGNKKNMVQIYCDACDMYNEAQENIKRNGSIVSHPRTGAPMENPYLKVRTQASMVIEKIGKNFPFRTSNVENGFDGF
jgi:P27 family predicted phage terminase small subunit